MLIWYNYLKKIIMNLQKGRFTDRNKKVKKQYNLF